MLNLQVQRYVCCQKQPLRFYSIDYTNQPGLLEGNRGAFGERNGRRLTPDTRAASVYSYSSKYAASGYSYISKYAASGDTRILPSMHSSDTRIVPSMPCNMQVAPLPPPPLRTKKSNLLSRTTRENANTARCVYENKSTKCVSKPPFSLCAHAHTCAPPLLGFAETRLCIHSRGCVSALSCVLQGFASHSRMRSCYIEEWYILSHSSLFRSLYLGL